MTAEIAIMNKEAVALASDSAVTVTGENRQKIFTSANKIFRLTYYHPVGVMIYGNANFMSVPWDTIIKIYRNNLGEKKFNTLKEYADSFIDFLDNENSLFPESVQVDYLKNSIMSYLSFMKETMLNEFKSVIKKNGAISDNEIKQIASDKIKDHYDRWDIATRAPSISKNFPIKLMSGYGNIIDEIIKKIFKEFPLSQYQHNKLKKMASNLFFKFPENIQKSDASGIVIAGFGDKDTFPSLKSFHIEGKVNDKLKYVNIISGEINFKRSAVVVPFAQTEMVNTFMEGIDPDCKEVQKIYINKIFEDYPGIIVENLNKYNDEEKQQLKKKLKDISVKFSNDFHNKFDNFIKQKYIVPITSVVAILPKDELAAMAESLVNLTSFKRKVSMEVESVGGPIDVAVISKGDGFIWIKRKHYFEPELNQQFFSNYYKEIANETI